MVPMPEPSMGQSPIHPIKHTSPRAALGQVTVILFQKYLTFSFTLANRTCLWSKIL